MRIGQCWRYEDQGGQDKGDGRGHMHRGGDGRGTRAEGGETGHEVIERHTEERRVGRHKREDRVGHKEGRTK